MVEPIEFYVINYNGERIPVIPNDDLTFRSTDGRNWSICEEGLRLNGELLSDDEVSINHPGPQDYYWMRAIHEFDEEEFPPLSYPIPGEEDE